MMKKNARVNSDEGRFVQAEEYLLATIAFVLSAGMERSGLTQRELADRLAVSEARISQLLSATGNPTARTLARVADALNCKAKFRFDDLEGADRRADVSTESMQQAAALEGAAASPDNMVQLAHWREKYSTARSPWSSSEDDEDTGTELVYVGVR